MALPTYPTGVKVFIDDVDVTVRIFGTDVLTLSDVHNFFPDIDITPYLKSSGRHKLKVTAQSGVGRVEARITLK